MAEDRGMKKTQLLASGDTPFWHILSSAEAANRLDVEPQTGLSSSEVERRVAQFGPNEIREHGARSL
jgi:magnesium-transporting ATPase (P-type)